MTYTPYNKEWEKEVMKNSKQFIISMLRNVASQRDEAAAELAALQAWVEELEAGIKEAQAQLNDPIETWEWSVVQSNKTLAALQKGDE